MLIEILGGECNQCKTQSDLVIHHIDKNPLNNKTENLTLLCYSHHRRIHRKPKPKPKKPPKPKRNITRAVLKYMLSGATLTSKDMAIACEIAPQTVRNMMVHLKTLRLVESQGFGQYQITDLGRDVYNWGSQPSTIHTSRREP